MTDEETFALQLGPMDDGLVREGVAVRQRHHDAL